MAAPTPFLEVLGPVPAPASYPTGNTLTPAEVSAEMTVETKVEPAAVLFEAYFRRLTGYARTRGAVDPEAVASEVLTAALERSDRFDLDRPETCSAYLHRAVRNRVIDEYRRRGRIEHVALADDQDPVGLGTMGTDVADRLISQESFDQLVDQLTPAQRDVVVHRFVDGHSTDETATLVGRSPAAVRRLQHDAISRLRLLLTSAALAVLLVVALAWIARQDSVPLVEVGPVDTEDGGEIVKPDLTPDLVDSAELAPGSQAPAVDPTLGGGAPSPAPGGPSPTTGRAETSSTSLTVPPAEGPNSTAGPAPSGGSIASATDPADDGVEVEVDVEVEVEVDDGDDGTESEDTASPGADDGDDDVDSSTDDEDSSTGDGADGGETDEGDPIDEPPSADGDQGAENEIDGADNLR